MSYPTHLDIMGAAMSDVSPLSSHAPAFAILDAIEKEIVDARNTFVAAYAMVHAKSEAEAAVVASRLESKGSAPDDLAFMTLYATAYKEKCARKKAALDANPLPAAILALVPHWRPLNLDKSGAKQEDIVAELRAMRYINEQLLLRLHAATMRMRELELRPRTIQFFFDQNLVQATVQIEGEVLKAALINVPSQARKGTHNEIFVTTSATLSIPCVTGVTSDDVRVIALLLREHPQKIFLKFHVVGDEDRRLFDAFEEKGNIGPQDHTGLRRWEHRWILRAPAEIPATAEPLKNAFVLM